MTQIPLLRQQDDHPHPAAAVGQLDRLIARLLGVHGHHGVAGHHGHLDPVAVEQREAAIVGSGLELGFHPALK